ncbi:2-isopropylmalate synthase [Thermotoga sp. SG1]|uniref:2-isopropylmalate synthase n=1 Tax=Thermotoga sp. SG1 TaxID=126739 RepID=UPI000C79498B|nr:2-isopropylmalate synthase [Thermotoga sp. SG1]PLV56685.1 2-isopropylmalate synthase [Thermotoga sp. SG1]
MRRIKIFDTTLRDGEQSPGASMSVEEKVEMALMLEDLGVDLIEAGFPVSSPVQFEAVKKVAGTVQRPIVVGLARCVEKDIDAAYEALKDRPKDKRMIHVFIATSPIHRKYKLRMEKEEILERVRKYVTYARQFFDLVEFSAEDASRTEVPFLIEVYRTAIESGATTINVPDTVGYALPDEFGELIRTLKEGIPGIENVDLSVHCHNDLGLAVANSIAAVQNGATQVEVTLNGIGERAGNCALEEFVMTLKVRKDRLPYETGIRTELIYPASRLLTHITGLIPSRNKPIVGENVFLHESGIHQDGVLKHRETYEIMKPSDIGRSSETLVLGRHSGKHALRKKLESYGIKLDDETFQKVFEKFTELADRKKEVYDDDLFSIVSEVLKEPLNGYKLIHFHVHTGNTLLPTAAVVLQVGNEKREAAEAGNGPVDAIFKAIDKALGLQPKLEEYIIQAVGTGKNAQGEVKLTLKIDGELYSGRGVSTDIVEASAIAYINAINKYLIAKGLLRKNGGVE